MRRGGQEKKHKKTISFIEMKSLKNGTETYCAMHLSLHRHTFMSRCPPMGLCGYCFLSLCPPIRLCGYYFMSLRPPMGLCGYYFMSLCPPIGLCGYYFLSSRKANM